MLIGEGALRKWWLPQFSAPLLIIRDPVIILIFFLAHQKGLIPQQPLYRFLIFQAAAGIALMLAQLVLLKLPPFVLLYGYRSLFLHFPLIFLLPLIFDYHDIVRLGRWILFLSIPMAILMAYQFNSPIDAWINRTVGMTGTFQLASALGKIRPPGTFSFISGPVAFFSLVTAFVGYGLVSHRKLFPRWLLVGAAISIGLAVAVSGSRATILSGGIVVGAWILGAVAGQRVSSAVANSLIIVLIATFVLGQIDLFHEGTEVLTERFELGRGVEAEQGGISGRFLRELLAPLRMIDQIPLFGAGLGVGTNVGATILTGKMQFLLSEGEWGRNVIEMGPFFGFLFVALRVGLTVKLGRDSLQAARKAHLLPLLLFSACAASVFSGQIAQPTTLGFTVLGAGLCLAALTHLPARVAEPERPAPKQFVLPSRGLPKL
ncbi:MAG TPA: hypothetical protein VK633_14145 [Verrucomicrobiae bacterium]|nr:hypothetical protein [Verrucomicrobiae bacterium]